MTEVKAELVGSVWKITQAGRRGRRGRCAHDSRVDEDGDLGDRSAAGKVKEIRVKETDVVKEGQVLVVLE